MIGLCQVGLADPELRDFPTGTEQRDDDAAAPLDVEQPADDHGTRTAFPFAADPGLSSLVVAASARRFAAALTVTVR
jgi:hypothetical protein